MSFASGRVLAPLTAVLLGIMLSAGLLEVGLRVAGETPWQEVAAEAASEPALHEPDSQLGWRNKPGRYVWDGRADFPPIELTFWEGGRRATGPTPKSRPRRVLLLGGSYTQGWAVSDVETFGWRLQASFPQVEFANFGTAGYGTTQSLMVLENELAAASVPPKLVIYGFIKDHRYRNIAHPGWLRGLSRRPSEGIDPRTPFANLVDGRLQVFPPITHPDWPLKRISAASAFLESRWLELRSRDRVARLSGVTSALLFEMNQTTEKAGTHLLVTILDPSRGRRKFLDRLRKQGIDAIDCAHPRSREIAFMVPVYGHPNAAVNAHWAKCIRRHLLKRGLLAAIPASAVPAQREHDNVRHGDDGPAAER